MKRQKTFQLIISLSVVALITLFSFRKKDTEKNGKPQTGAAQMEVGS